MTVLFDGHDLGELAICGEPRFTVLNSEVSYHEVQGGRGSVVKSRRWAPAKVSFTLGIEGDARQRRSKLSELGSFLDVDGARRLVLPDNPDWYYMAVPDGSLDVSRYVDASAAQISFTLTDPVAYGFERSVTVPSGGSVSLNVGGTHRTYPLVKAVSAVRSLSSEVWGVRLDGGDFLHVATGKGGRLQRVLGLRGENMRG